MRHFASDLKVQSADMLIENRKLELQKRRNYEVINIHAWCQVRDPMSGLQYYHGTFADPFSGTLPHSQVIRSTEVSLFHTTDQFSQELPSRNIIPSEITAVVPTTHFPAVPTEC